MQIIAMQGISKSFGSTQALKGVDFELEQGEILSLLGENGAGKTTLMKILYGMYRPDEGEIFVGGKPAGFHSPVDAIHAGICMVHQHFMLVPAFTVMENIIAGNEPRKGMFVDTQKARAQVGELIDRFRFHLSPDTPVGALSVGEQQRVEILKALYRNADVLILDEPSAVLTPNEVDDLFETLKALRSQGKSIIIITHKLYETINIADRIAVLRDGLMIRRDVRPADTNVIELSDMMVGRPIQLDVKRPAKRVGEPYFCAKSITLTEDGTEKLKDISFEIRRGEIYGIAGVEGNGQTQLLEVVTGLKTPRSMRLTLGGVPLEGGAHEFIRRKVGHVPEDRSSMGLVSRMSIKENMILGYHDFPDICNRWGFLRYRHIKDYTRQSIDRFQIKTKDMELPVHSLSGGNQQKVVMARVLSRDLEFLVVAHPTRGIDIGSSEYMHEQIIRFRDSGKAVLLISADLDEVYTLSDRLAVLYEGRIVAECSPQDYTKVELGMLMTGVPLEQVKREAAGADAKQ